MKKILIILLIFFTGSSFGTIGAYILLRPTEYTKSELIKTYKKMLLTPSSIEWAKIFQYQCSATSKTEAPLAEATLIIMDEFPLFLYKNYIKGETKVLNILNTIFDTQLNKLSFDYQSPKKIFHILDRSLKYAKEQIPIDKERHKSYITHLEKRLSTWEQNYLKVALKDPLDKKILEKAREEKTSFKDLNDEVFGVINNKEKAISIAEKVIQNVFGNEVSQKKPFNAELIKDEWVVRPSRSLSRHKKKRPFIIIDKNIGRIVGVTTN